MSKSERLTKAYAARRPRRVPIIDGESWTIIIVAIPYVLALIYAFS